MSDCRFVTFYSYKGGVGRSMTLANVASWLVTAAHKRVLAVDFDLEAPGLDYYFARSGLLGDQRPDKGLVDWLTEYRTAGTVPDLGGFVVEGPEQLGGGRLSLLSAGDAGRDGYGEDLAALDWNALYETGFGFELMEHLRVALVDGYQPDLVLVDSRTGLHGIGAIAAQQLPDVVVLLFSLNEQNVDGTARVLANVEQNVFGPDTGREIQSLLVASPVYEAGLPEASDAIEQAERTLGRPVDARMPFSSAAVYGEQVWRVDDRDGPASLLLEYQRLGRLLGEEPVAGGDDDGMLARLLRAQGYSVAPPEDPRLRVDLLAERPDVLGTRRLGVLLERGTGRGRGGLVGDTARMVARTSELDEALILTEAEPTKVLRKAADRERGVAVRGVPELLDQLVDWRPYLEWLTRSTQDEAWAEHVGRLRLQEPGGEAAPADAWVQDWLEGPEPLLLLVGPRSASRGTLSRWLAHDLGEAALQRTWVSDGRIPVLLPLGQYRKELDVDTLLGDLLADRRRFPRVPRGRQAVEALRLLNDEGRLLLIVDELDALPTPEEALAEVARLAGPRAKVLVNRYVDTPERVRRDGLPPHRVARFV